MAEADRLAEYEKRRDFSKTREPKRGRKRKAGKQLGFVVQKHDARRLHYDFRLEWDGALLSWAVTRGPSDDPGEKRLAVRTEDHPLDYADFEGTIPKGHYGGGTVMVWDRGTWEPLHDPAEGLKAGKLHFNLSGERMKGGWALVRMRPRKGEKRENWLLIKERDDAAGEKPEALTETNAGSVKTGRSLKEIETGAEPKDAKPAKKPVGSCATRGKAAKMPAFQKPQLATLYDAAPEGDGWLHETKFDGYRCIAAVAGGKARLFTRTGKDWTEKYGALADAFAPLGHETMLLDGEVMAANIPKGQSAFSALQATLQDGDPLVFYVFDILERGGKPLTAKPLTDRKAVLEQALSPLDPDGPVRLSTYIRGDGGDILSRICKAGGEGIVSKQADAPYSHSRTNTWRKVKCTRRQEFVIGGYSPSDKKGRPFSSLLVGQFDEDGGFRYRGRIGTGFSEETLEALAKRFAARTRKSAPFDDVPAAIARKARWVRPDLVAEIDFAEFTADGHIRHGAFLGLRDDKEAKTVTEEKSKETPKQSGRIKPGQDRDAEDEATVAGIAITHPDRMLFGDAGITKLDLAKHYGRVGERMLAASGERPFSLLRFPSGIDGESFFQKHAGKGFPEALSEIEIEEKDGGTAQYLYTRTPEGFVAAAQFGTIEFHGWGARVDKLERPDRLIFDLDPDEGLGWTETKKAAFDLRDLLEEIGLAATAMVTGGKGVHVTVPLRRSIDWDTLKMFAKAFAHILAEREPERFTATMSKEKRKGRIFIDWLRNERGATAIMPYSARGRPGAPVATPVTWDELKGLKSAAAFTLSDMEKRLAAPCPYIEAFRSPQSLSAKVIDGLEKLSG